MSLNLTSDFIKVSRETCSEAFLGEIIRHEAVHAIDGDTDLSRRMGEPGTGLEHLRGMFAFRDPEDKNQPLAFIAFALVSDTPRQIQKILNGEDAFTDPSCAIAVPYSISRVKTPKTKGADIGAHLIFKALGALREQKPQVKTRMTLSPIPGLKAWVLKNLDDAFLNRHRKNGLITLPADLFRRFAQDPKNLDPFSVLAEQLRRLALTYLLFADTDGVAKFHCGNGAIVENLHINADMSPKGMNESFGLMANYFYPDDTQREKNAKDYAERKRPFCSQALGATLSQKTL